MTIGELIERLKQFPHDATVFIDSDAGGGAGIETIKHDEEYNEVFLKAY